MSKGIATINKCHCVICGQYKERSLEHIIPRALGNETLETYNVCKDCNCKLGENVDSYLSNNFFIQVIRQKLGIAGQSGKIPNPFKNGVDENGNHVKVDQDHKIHIVQNVKVDGEMIYITAETKEQAKTIAKKRLKRMSASDNFIQNALMNIEKAPTYKISLPLTYHVKVNFKRLHLAVLKMAYEYACLKLGGDYHTDPTAIKIRDILHDATKGIYDKQYQEVWQTLPLIGLSPPSAYLPHHFIMLVNSDNQVMAYISLFMSAAFSFGVCISGNAALYEKTLKDNCIMDRIDIQIRDN